MALLKLDYYDKFMRPYEDGESQRSARSKLGLFLEDMGFPAQKFEGSQLKNDLKQAKINDLRQGCNAFCKEFRERYDIEGSEECQETLISYFDSLKQRALKGKLVGGTIKNRKFTVKRLVEKVMMTKDIDWEEIFNGLPKPSRFAQDRIYTMEEIRQICKYTDPRIKPIVYFFVSSGVRLGAFDYLKWGHISPQERNGKIVCALVEVYKDTHDQYPTLITVESYNALKEWMDFRDRSGEKITPDSWIMRDYWDTKEGFTHGMAREPQQLKSSGIKGLIDSAVRRQGLRKNLTNGKKRHDVQLNHSYRKFRETQLIRAGLKLVDVNILQGHANGGMVDHYYRPSADPNNRIDDYLINEFLKAEKYLIIDEAYMNTDELKEKITQEVTAKMKDDYAKIRQKMIYMTFNGVIKEMKIERRELKQYGSVSPHEQLEYFMKSNEAKFMDKDELELLQKMIDEDKIHKISLLSPHDDDDGLEISYPSTFELEKIEGWVKKNTNNSNLTDEERKEILEAIKTQKNL